METQNSIYTTFDRSPITCTEIKTSLKEGTMQAMLKQKVIVTTHYPSKKVTNSKSSALFSMSDFGFTPQSFPHTSNRVAFVPVPMGLTPEEVLAVLPKEACIYVEKSNHPILTDEQKYAIQSGQRTLDQFADVQVVRYPKDHEDASKADKVALDKNGKVQYRQCYYFATIKEDIDNRNSIVGDMYVSPAINAELMQGVNAPVADLATSGM